MRKRQVVVRREKPASRNNNINSSTREVIVSYGECQKNHAAAVGGYAVDGCREFMASNGDASLTCVACGCHRSFHRRQAEATHEDQVGSDSSNPT